MGGLGEYYFKPKTCSKQPLLVPRPNWSGDNVCLGSRTTSMLGEGMTTVMQVRSAMLISQ